MSVNPIFNSSAHRKVGQSDQTSSLDAANTAIEGVVHGKMGLPPETVLEPRERVVAQVTEEPIHASKRATELRPSIEPQQMPTQSSVVEMQGSKASSNSEQTSLKPGSEQSFGAKTVAAGVADTIVKTGATAPLHRQQMKMQLGEVPGGLMENIKDPRTWRGLKLNAAIGSANFFGPLVLCPVLTKELQKAAPGQPIIAAVGGPLAATVIGVGLTQFPSNVSLESQRFDRSCVDILKDKYAQAGNSAPKMIQEGSRGAGPKVVRNATHLAIMMPIRDKMNGLVRVGSTGTNGAPIEAIVDGAVNGGSAVLALFGSMPIDNAMKRMIFQHQDVDNWKGPGPKPAKINVLQAAEMIWKEQGVLGFARGIEPAAKSVGVSFFIGGLMLKAADTIYENLVSEDAPKRKAGSAQLDTTAGATPTTPAQEDSYADFLATGGIAEFPVYAAEAAEVSLEEDSFGDFLATGGVTPRPASDYGVSENYEDGLSSPRAATPSIFEDEEHVAMALDVLPPVRSTSSVAVEAPVIDEESLARAVDVLPASNSSEEPASKGGGLFSRIASGFSSIFGGRSETSSRAPSTNHVFGDHTDYTSNDSETSSSSVEASAPAASTSTEASVQADDSGSSDNSDSFLVDNFTSA